MTGRRRRRRINVDGVFVGGILLLCGWGTVVLLVALIAAGNLS
ncbi:hypothetical protein [Streptomyces halobius]|nr:hypothetical protein [Streptomyces halobius]